MPSARRHPHSSLSIYMCTYLARTTAVPHAYSLIALPRAFVQSGTLCKPYKLGNRRSLGLKVISLACAVDRPATLPCYRRICPSSRTMLCEFDISFADV